MMQEETAVFGGGCFWCTEAIFTRLKGVEMVIPGYAGGKMTNPSYEDVSTDTTGHAEVVKIIFDPKVISYETLLDVFFHVHDPTSLNRQGADVGKQYRSVILFTSDDQKRKAQESKRKIQTSGEFKNPLVTEIKELDKFYDAETYHQQYFAKNPSDPYCNFVIAPKLHKILDQYKDLLQ